MVRRHLSTALALASLALIGCGREREMANDVEMPDSMSIMRAMQNDDARDSMLDTMPGGEMARGDSLAEMKMLKKKM